MFGEDDEEDRPGIKAKKKVNETVSLFDCQEKLDLSFRLVPCLLSFLTRKIILKRTVK